MPGEGKKFIATVELTLTRETTLVIEAEDEGHAEAEAMRQASEELGWVTTGKWYRLKGLDER